MVASAVRFRATTSITGEQACVLGRLIDITIEVALLAMLVHDVMWVLLIAEPGPLWLQNPGVVVHLSGTMAAQPIRPTSVPQPGPVRQTRHLAVCVGR